MHALLIIIVSVLISILLLLRDIKEEKEELILVSSNQVFSKFITRTAFFSCLIFFFQLIIECIRHIWILLIT